MLQAWFLDERNHIMSVDKVCFSLDGSLQSLATCCVIERELKQEASGQLLCIAYHVYNEQRYFIGRCIKSERLNGKVRLTLESVLGGLQDRCGHYCFARQTLQSIIEKVFFKQLAFVDTMVCLDWNPILECAYQGELSDWEFLQSLFLDYGLFCFYDFTEDNVTVVITDTIQESESLNVSYAAAMNENRVKPRITRVTETLSLQTKTIRNSYYVPFAEKQQLTRVYETSSSVPASGHCEKFSIIEKFESENARIIQRKGEALDARRFYLTLEVTHDDGLPGRVVGISGHPDISGQDRFRIVSVNTTLHCSHKLSAVDCQSVWKCVPNPTLPRPYGSKVRVCRYQEAKIAGQHDVDMDVRGRYQCEFANHFGLPRVRLLQPLTGLVAGMHFRMQKGTAVLLATVEDVSDRFVIIGETTRKYPCFDSMVLQSIAGHQMKLSEQQDEKFSLVSASKRLALSFVDASENSEMRFQAKESDVEIKSQDAIYWKSDSEIIWHAENDYVVIARKQYALISNSGSLYFRAQQDIKWHTSYQLVLNHEEVFWQAKGAIHLDLAQADVKCEHGTWCLDKTVRLEAAIANFSVKRGALVLRCGLSKIELKNGTLSIEGEEVVFTGQTISLASPSFHFS